MKCPHSLQQHQRTAFQLPEILLRVLCERDQRVALFVLFSLAVRVLRILQVFYEEELDVPLVLFNEVLDHVLRIDRIFRQPQGHLLLIGVSGAGKTTLSRFVAWMNGLSVFQVKVHNKYTAEDFDEDLRGVLRRSGCRVSVRVSEMCFSVNRILTPNSD